MDKSPEENSQVVSSDESSVSTSTKPAKKFNIASLVGQLPLILALLIIIGIMLIWHPWSSNNTGGERTITVTGQSTITAEPDEYVFSPEYEFTGNQQTALSDSTSKINDVVAKLKALGIADKDIKTNTSGYNNDYYDPGTSTYYAYMTITVDDKALAQKVQDYLLTTSPTGSVTPYANFSKSKEKQLTDTARDEATKDARAKADQNAKNLGFKIGKVKTFKDEPENNFISPLMSGVTDSLVAGADSAQSTPIEQGQNDLTYDVTVTYYIN